MAGAGGGMFTGITFNNSPVNISIRPTYSRKHFYIIL